MSKSIAYLTKRRLVSATRQGVKKAARETMEVMGHTVVARDGWVVKVYQNGDSERLQPLEQPDVQDAINLD